MTRYQNASTEPLESIRVNECEAPLGLATSRFQALWNEIERLRAVEYAVRREALLEAARMCEEAAAECKADGDVRYATYTQGLAKGIRSLMEPDAE